MLDMAKIGEVMDLTIEFGPIFNPCIAAETTQENHCNSISWLKVKRNK